MIGAIGSARDFEERYDRIPENARHGFTVALLLENLALYGTIGEVLRDFENRTMSGNGWATVRICELDDGRCVKLLVCPEWVRIAVGSDYRGWQYIGMSERATKAVRDHFGIAYDPIRG